MRKYWRHDRARRLGRKQGDYLRGRMGKIFAGAGGLGGGGANGAFVGIIADQWGIGVHLTREWRAATGIQGLGLANAIRKTVKGGMK